MAEQTDKTPYYIASFSGGKDSTAVVLRLIEIGAPLDEVLFCDTTMEFPAMYKHVERVKAAVEAAGIKFTTIRAEHDFEYYMLHHKPKRRAPARESKTGYSWPDTRARWCTRALKLNVIRRYIREIEKKHDVRQYIGIATDEARRLERPENQQPGKTFPLIEWGWTEKDALQYCYGKGYDWDGLYNIFARVSCWCCPLKSFDEYRKLYEHFPDLWEKLKDLDARTWRKFQENYSVKELEKRFNLERALAAAGYNIRNREFYADLKQLLQGNADIEQILQDREKQIKIGG